MTTRAQASPPSCGSARFGQRRKSASDLFRFSNRSPVASPRLPPAANQNRFCLPQMGCDRHKGPLEVSDSCPGPSDGKAMSLQRAIRKSFKPDARRRVEATNASEHRTKRHQGRKFLAPRQQLRQVFSDIMTRGSRHRVCPVGTDCFRKYPALD